MELEDRLHLTAIEDAIHALMASHPDVAGLRRALKTAMAMRTNASQDLGFETNTDAELQRRAIATYQERMLRWIAFLPSEGSGR